MRDWLRRQEPLIILAVLFAGLLLAVAAHADAINFGNGVVPAANGGAGTVTGALKGNGSGTVSQGACGDLSNAAPSCSTDTTNAGNLSSGTLPAARLPSPAATTLGGVESIAPVSHEWVDSISTAGAPHQSQPAAADVSGLAASATTDATNAANITSGTLPSARLGNALGVLISTQTASNSATLKFTALPAYANYRLVCSALVPVSSAVVPAIEFGENGVLEGTGYHYAGRYEEDSATSAVLDSTSATYIQPMGGVSNTAANGGISLEAGFGNIASTSQYKSLRYRAQMYNGTNFFTSYGGGVYTGDTNAITDIAVFFASGNISSGACSVYGLSS